MVAGARCRPQRILPSTNGSNSSDGNAEDVPGDESRKFDLLYRGLELSSGGQREHDVDRLRKQVADLDDVTGAILFPQTPDRLTP